MQVFRTGVVAVVAALGLQSATRANSLGVAGDYNAFIFHNMDQRPDSEGALAVGGNLTLSNYSVASKLANTGTHLVVGGNLTFNSGTIHGSAIVGGDTIMNSGGPTGDITTGGNYSGNNGPTNGGTIYYGGSYNGPNWEKNTKILSVTLPIDFSSVQKDLLQTSSSLSQLANTGTWAKPYSTITFTGTNAGMNVFSIDASILANSTININLPANAFAVINVTGAGTVALPNSGFAFTGAGNASDVLWNLNGVTTLSMQSFYGSILAPTATVTFSSGNLDGTLIADNLSGGGELHNVLFSHDIPLVSVPLPMSVYPGAALLAGLVLLRRARRSATAY